MTYVILEACIDNKDSSCVEVCPVDCIHPTPEEEGYALAKQLYIDPTECIDCNSCVDACVADYDVPPEQGAMVEVNAAFFRS
jgi:ferredoxin